MKALMKLEKLGFDEKAMYEILIKDAFADAAFSREIDLLEKGRPGYYTKEFMDLAMTHLERLYKLKYGELNRNVNVNIDLTNAIVEAYKKRKSIEDGNDSGSH